MSVDVFTSLTVLLTFYFLDITIGYFQDNFPIKILQALPVSNIRAKFLTFPAWSPPSSEVAID